MSVPRLSGLAGAAFAIGVFAAAAVFPLPLDEARPTLLPAEPALSACANPDCEPGPAGFVARLDERLAERIPQIDEEERRDLARTIVAEAVEARIDPLLVLALIEVESGFDPDALSDRGARGLMQLRRPTLVAELTRAGLAPGAEDDPIANVRAGVRYLRRLLDAFGREDVALMAYNAGPNRIVGYMRAEGGVPERFHAYPRRVRAEHSRLQRRLFADRAPATFADARPLPADPDLAAPARFR